MVSDKGIALQFEVIKVAWMKIFVIQESNSFREGYYFSL